MSTAPERISSMPMAVWAERTAKEYSGADIVDIDEGSSGVERGDQAKLAHGVIGIQAGKHDGRRCRRG